MSKSYRNRLSLFLRLSSTKSHVSTEGVSSDFYPYSTNPTGSLTQMVSPATSPLSTPTSPLPTSSLKSPQSIHIDNYAPIRGEPIPPTTNDLDAEEKARLLKKTRKLSRVFGEIPVLPPQQVPHRESSLHQRTSSLAASESSHSSRSPRRSPSQQNLPYISEVPYDDNRAVQPRKSQQRQRTSREHSLRSVSSQPGGFRSQDETSPPNSPTSTQSSRRGRMAKLRRHLGEDNIPVELVSDILPVKYRKSLDTLSLEKSKKRSNQGKQLRKTRSFAVEKSSVAIPIQDAVDFHRRYVQNFGEAGIMHGETSRSGEVHTHNAAVPEPLNRSEEVDSSPSSHSEHCQTLLESALPNSSFLSLTPRHSEEDLRSRRRNDSSVSIETMGSGLDFVSTGGFQERRRRAAKLTQFFGVGYQDISASLPYVAYDIPRSSNLPGPGVRVDVKMSGRRFWGDGHGTLRDADIVDVIDKLRDLKAS